MLDTTEKRVAFRSINAGYNSVFKPAQLSLGLVAPIESYMVSDTPTMDQHIERTQLAEALGFSAIWLRDVPFRVPSFGDAGQGFDPFVYLGVLSAHTTNIALGVASIVLPLRHPAHVAKAAATADVLSNGRLILGIASGDRPEEYPALNISYSARGERFRDSYEYIRKVGEKSPHFENKFGHVAGEIDMLPRPTAGRLPLLVTGSCQQSADWIAKNGDGWMTYPRPALQQTHYIDDLRCRAEQQGEAHKPVMEPLYIDLVEDAETPPTPIHLGLRLGVNALRDYLKSREAIGVNHIALNLRFNRANTEQTLQRLATEILPTFE
jgi:luciferase-type oxidoreductase